MLRPKLRAITACCCGTFSNIKWNSINVTKNSSSVKMLQPTTARHRRMSCNNCTSVTNIIFDSSVCCQLSTPRMCKAIDAESDLDDVQLCSPRTHDVKAAQEFLGFWLLWVTGPDPGVVVPLVAVGHERSWQGEGHARPLDRSLQALQEGSQESCVFSHRKHPGDWAAMSEVVDDEDTRQDEMWAWKWNAYLYFCKNIEQIQHHPCFKQMEQLQYRTKHSRLLRASPKDISLYGYWPLLVTSPTGRQKF